MSGSGSRAPSNPTTKAQRLTRVAELTSRMDDRAAQIEVLGAERNRIVAELRSGPIPVTFAEIAQACGKSEQAIYKSFYKPGTGHTPPRKHALNGG